MFKYVNEGLREDLLLTKPSINKEFIIIIMIINENDMKPDDFLILYRPSVNNYLMV
jgi:hypothetical protein